MDFCNRFFWKILLKFHLWRFECIRYFVFTILKVAYVCFVCAIRIEFWSWSPRSAWQFVYDDRTEKQRSWDHLGIRLYWSHGPIFPTWNAAEVCKSGPGRSGPIKLVVPLFGCPNERYLLSIVSLDFRSCHCFVVCIIEFCIKTIVIKAVRLSHI